MIERRAHPRLESNRIALLRLDGARRFEACRVLNLSLGGALLASPHADLLPDSLALYMDAQNQRLGVEVVQCRVVRRRGDQVAVQFADTRRIEGLYLGVR